MFSVGLPPSGLDDTSRWSLRLGRSKEMDRFARVVFGTRTGTGESGSKPYWKKNGGKRNMGPRSRNYGFGAGRQNTNQQFRRRANNMGLGGVDGGIGRKERRSGVGIMQEQCGEAEVSK